MPQLIITFGEGKPTTITGPIDQKEMCYHVLLDALIALTNYDPKKIVPVTILPFDPTKGGMPGGVGGRG